MILGGAYDKKAKSAGEIAQQRAEEGARSGDKEKASRESP